MYSKTIIAVVTTLSILSISSTITPSVIPTRLDSITHTIYENNINDKEDVNMKLDSKIDTKTTKPIKVIVELISVPESKDKNISIKEQHDEFKEFIATLNKNKTIAIEQIKITHEYDLVLNGMALTIPGNRIEELLESPLIKKIWNNDTIELEPPITTPIDKKLDM